MRYQVQAPFETRPGEIPRRIQIERKRRLYVQHRIEDLLLDRGVDHSQPPKSALAFLSPSIPPMPVEVSFHNMGSRRFKLRQLKLIGQHRARCSGRASSCHTAGHAQNGVPYRTQKVFTRVTRGCVLAALALNLPFAIASAIYAQSP